MYVHVRLHLCLNIGCVASCSKLIFHAFSAWKQVKQYLETKQKLDEGGQLRQFLLHCHWNSVESWIMMNNLAFYCVYNVSTLTKSTKRGLWQIRALLTMEVNNNQRRDRPLKVVNEPRLQTSSANYYSIFIVTTGGIVSNELTGKEHGTFQTYNPLWVSDY